MAGRKDPREGNGQDVESEQLPLQTTRLPSRLNVAMLRLPLPRGLRAGQQRRSPLPVDLTGRT